MQERPPLGRIGKVKGPLVPDTPFIEQERFALRVPIAWHVEVAGSVKVILDQLGLGFRLVVFEKRVVVFQGLRTIVEEPYIVWVDDGLPLAVQTGCRTPTDIRY